MTWNYDEYRAREEAKRISLAEDVIGIAKYLNKCGYKYIVVQYQGAGDSGDCYECEGFKTQEEFNQSKYDGGEYVKKSDWIDGQSVPLPKKEWVWTRQQIEVENCIEKYNAMNNTKHDLPWMLTDLIQYDWYNNDGGQGRVILDTEKCIVEVEGQQNTTAYFNASEKTYLDGSQPNTSDHDTELQWDGY